MPSDLGAFEKALENIRTSNSSNISANCLVTLCKVLDNILSEKEYNARIRSIKLNNKVFHDRVGRVSGGIDSLLACGFSYATLASKRPVKQLNDGTLPPNDVQLLQAMEDKEFLTAWAENHENDVWKGRKGLS